MAVNAGGLTLRQQRFVEYYLIDGNATQAAIKAGYSANTAQVIGSENLTKPLIKAAIDAGMEKTSSKLEITRERVLLEYARMAFFEPSKLLDDHGEPKPISELDDDTRAMVGIDFKGSDKRGALDSLSRYFGMFNDKVKLEGQVAIAKIPKLADLYAKAGNETKS